MNCGIPNYIYSRAGSNEAISRSLCDMLLIPGIILGISYYFALIILFYYFFSFTDPIIFAVCGLRLLFAWGEIYRSRFRGLGCPERYVFLRVFSLIVCLFGICFLFFMDLSPIFYCMLWAFEWMFFSVLVLLKEGRPSFRHNWTYLRLVYSRNFSVYIQVICVAFYYRFDQLFLGLINDFGQLGVYAISARVAEAFNMTFGLIGLVIGPKLIKNFRSGLIDPLHVKFIMFSFIFLLSISIFLVEISVNFFSLILGDEYSNSQHIFSIYVLSSIFTMLGFLGTQICIAMGLWKAPLLSGLAGVLVCAVATPLFWQLFGVLGVAFATVVSYAAAAIVVWYNAIRATHLLTALKTHS